jgi:hypothetical protein
VCDLVGRGTFLLSALVQPHVLFHQLARFAHRKKLAEIKPHAVWPGYPNGPISVSLDGHQSGRGSSRQYGLIRDRQAPANKKSRRDLVRNSGRGAFLISSASHFQVRCTPPAALVPNVGGALARPGRPVLARRGIQTRANKKSPTEFGRAPTNVGGTLGTAHSVAFVAGRRQSKQ